MVTGLVALGNGQQRRMLTLWWPGRKERNKISPLTAGHYAPLLPVKSHFPISLLTTKVPFSYESLNEAIHPRGQIPHDPLTSQRRHFGCRCIGNKAVDPWVGGGHYRSTLQQKLSIETFPQAVK